MVEVEKWRFTYLVFFVVVNFVRKTSRTPEAIWESGRTDAEMQIATNKTVKHFLPRRWILHCKSWPFKNRNFVNQQWPFIYQTFQPQLLTRYKGASKTCCLHLIGAGIRHFGGNALPQGVKDRNHLLGSPKTEDFGESMAKIKAAPQKLGANFFQDSNMGQEIPFWMSEASTVPSWLPMVLMSHITVPLGAVGVSGLAITRVPWVSDGLRLWWKIREALGINTKHCKW